MTRQNTFEPDQHWKLKRMQKESLRKITIQSELRKGLEATVDLIWQKFSPDSNQDLDMEA